MNETFLKRRLAYTILVITAIFVILLICAVATHAPFDAMLVLGFGAALGIFTSIMYQNDL